MSGSISHNVGSVAECISQVFILLVLSVLWILCWEGPEFTFGINDEPNM